MLLGGLPWPVRVVAGVGLLAFAGYRLSEHQAGVMTVILGIAGLAVLLVGLAGANRNRAKR
jgi:hypothetical protein